MTYWTRLIEIVSLGYRRPSKKTPQSDEEAARSGDAQEPVDADADASRVYIVCHPSEDEQQRDDVAFDSAQDAVVEASMRQAVDGVHRKIRTVRFVACEEPPRPPVACVDRRLALDELPERAKRVAEEAIAAREASTRAREADLDSVADDVRVRWEAIRARLERLSATVAGEKKLYAARFVTDRGMSSALVRELSDAADARLAREQRIAKDASERLVRESSATLGIRNVDLASLFTSGKLTPAAIAP